MKILVKIVKELIIFLIVIAVSVGGVVFVVRSIKADRNYDTFNAKIEKRELRIVSPVFGNIENFSVLEGQLVKKGDLIAIIKFFSVDKEKPSIVDSRTFTIQDNEVRVISPVDSIVAKKLLAENSVLKPGVDFLVLYPLKEAVVKVSVPKSGSDLSNYKKLSVVDEGEEFPIQYIKLLPIDQDSSGGNINFAEFLNIEDSKRFYNGQEVIVKGEKDGKSNAMEFTPIPTETPSAKSTNKPLNPTSAPSVQDNKLSSPKPTSTPVPTTEP